MGTLSVGICAVLFRCRSDQDAQYIWVPWKFLTVPEYAHGYFCRKFSWAFVPIDPMNVRTKFEVPNFTHS